MGSVCATCFADGKANFKGVPFRIDPVDVFAVCLAAIHEKSLYLTRLHRKESRGCCRMAQIQGVCLAFGR